MYHIWRTYRILWCGYSPNLKSTILNMYWLYIGLNILVILEVAFRYFVNNISTGKSIYLEQTTRDSRHWRNRPREATNICVLIPWRFCPRIGRLYIYSCLSKTKIFGNLTTRFFGTLIFIISWMNFFQYRII